MIRFWDFSLYFTERVTNVLVEFDVRGKQGMDFFTGESNYRDYEQILASQDINWWTGVVGLWWCFYQLFRVSFWRHPFTAEHPLVRQVIHNAVLLSWPHHSRLAFSVLFIDTQWVFMMCETISSFVSCGSCRKLDAWYPCKTAWDTPTDVCVKSWKSKAQQTSMTDSW